MYSKEYPNNGIYPDTETYIKSYGKASENIKGIQDMRLLIDNCKSSKMTDD